MIWCGSTEVFHKPAAVHQTLKDFRVRLAKERSDIAPSQIYAYAAFEERRAVSPMVRLISPRYAGAVGVGSRAPGYPICGKDFQNPVRLS